MYEDCNCPYCGADVEINHDDGYGYEEDECHEQVCGECDKAFVYTTSISFYYEATKADCLNGAEHDLYPVKQGTKWYPDWVRCKDCSYESQGELDAQLVKEKL